MKRLSVLWANGKVRSECRYIGSTDPFVGTVTYRAQCRTPNGVYAAITGIHHDGHDHIDEAITRGAALIICEHPLKTYQAQVLYLIHPHVRRVVSSLCYAQVDAIPSDIIGVTGTDGKSTTCDFLHQILCSMGVHSALLSSITMDDGTGRHPSPYRQSTPEAPQLYEFFSRCAANRVERVVLETTSHGLSTEGARLADITFAAAVLTPITHEHLEFHQSLARYVDAKMNLVRQVRPGGSVILPEDFPYLHEVMQAKHESVHLLTYSYNDAVPANLYARQVHQSLYDQVIEVVCSSHSSRFSLPYGQRCHADNFLGALLGASASTAIPITDIHPTLQMIPGRFEQVPVALPITVIIDFAHTERSFSLLFSHVRAHHRNSRIIALFGAAGERDRAKRSPMGKVAGLWCDVIILTDEDPRGEDPVQILDDLESGIRDSSFQGTVMRIHDRRKAIEWALRTCQPHDILLLLAKSHETTIQYRDHHILWNERDMVLQLAKELKEQ